MKIYNSFVVSEKYPGEKSEKFAYLNNFPNLFTSSLIIQSLLRIMRKANERRVSQVKYLKFMQQCT